MNPTIFTNKSAYATGLAQCAVIMDLITSHSFGPCPYVRWDLRALDGSQPKSIYCPFQTSVVSAWALDTHF